MRFSKNFLSRPSDGGPVDGTALNIGMHMINPDFIRVTLLCGIARSACSSSGVGHAVDFGGEVFQVKGR
jgi:hypothetical protein